MNRTLSKGHVVKWATGLFAYGTVVHLLLLRYFVRWAYADTSDTTFVNHPLTNVSLPVLGGICVSFLLLGLLHKTSDRDLTALRTILEAGLRAMGATILALELFYILTSAYLALFWSHVDAVSQPPALERIAGGFILWFIDIQTYGFEAVVLSLPFSFPYGCVAGAIIVGVKHKRHARMTGS